QRLAALIVGVALGLLTQEVRASSGYVCFSVFQPQLPSWGYYGLVYATYYSAPNCTGNFVEASYYCTVGATNGNCNLNSLYSDAGIQGLSQNLQRAAAWDQRVYNLTSTSGAVGVYFYSN